MEESIYILANRKNLLPREREPYLCRTNKKEVHTVYETQTSNQNKDYVPRIQSSLQNMLTFFKYLETLLDDVYSSNDVETNFSSFLATLEHYCDVSFPMKYVNVNKPVRFWITSTIIESSVRLKDL
ncbi:hypothetical protein Trydic_g19754 [Trypoxylus dichotomus]